MITKHELIRGTTSELAEYFSNLTEGTRNRRANDEKIAKMTDDKANLLISKEGFLLQLEKITTLVSLLFYLDITEKKLGNGDVETNMELKSSYVHIEDKKVKGK